METFSDACHLIFLKTDNVSKYLPIIDNPALYAEFYSAVSENDEDIRVILHENETIGLASVYDGGGDGYLYILIFAEYRNHGYGYAAAMQAEQQFLSSKPKEIYTSYSTEDETARQFAEKCGFVQKYASACMTYHGKRFTLPELPVRQYEDADYMAAFTLYAEAFHKMRLETGCFPDSVPKSPSDESRKFWAETRQDRYVYVADHEIVGYAHLEGSELSSVSIKISQQGKGFGKNFVRYLVNHMMENGSEAPSLWCVIGNEKARHLYDILGFKEDYRVAFATKMI